MSDEEDEEGGHRHKEDVSKPLFEEPKVRRSCSLHMLASCLWCGTLYHRSVLWHLTHLGVVSTLLVHEQQVIDRILCHKEVTEDGQTVTKYLVKWKVRSLTAHARFFHFISDCLRSCTVCSHELTLFMSLLNLIL
jgi:hypothetical protein